MSVQLTFEGRHKILYVDLFTTVSCPIKHVEILWKGPGDAEALIYECSTINNHKLSHPICIQCLTAASEEMHETIY